MRTLFFPTADAAYRNIDHWGYYNSNGVSSLIPNIPIGNYTYGLGANRNTHATRVKIGILEKVTYPTKGYTIFDFEPHEVQWYDYGEGSTPQTNRLAGGLRIAAIETLQL